MDIRHIMLYTPALALPVGIFAVNREPTPTTVGEPTSAVALAGDRVALAGDRVALTGDRAAKSSLWHRRHSLRSKPLSGHFKLSTRSWPPGNCFCWCLFNSCWCCSSDMWYFRLGTCFVELIEWTEDWAEEDWLDKDWVDDAGPAASGDASSPSVRKLGGSSDIAGDLLKRL